ncbi:MAG: DEAD/DEAH box helicase family protein, partial [Thaumarchaeota archaeon]|nr:DEAD/DEAH box helicase family protein [Nitrososphaerota archaeon]
MISLRQQGVGFSQVLEELRKAAGDNGVTKGRLFERLTKSFLQAHDLYRRRFRRVWLWDEYPDRDGRRDFGVDLVAEEHDGTRCAIQCKFYAKKTLAKSDIDSFLEAASRENEFGSMMLVYTARGYGKQAEEALRGHNCHVLDFGSLTGSNVEWPDLTKGLVAVRRKKPFELMAHQREALQKVSEGLRDADRGQMIMACGTGKTITALRIAERMCGGKSGLVLYAVPSISLMQQTIRAWSEQRKTEHAYVGVCSDPKVSHGEATDIPILEMEIGVTTDESAIAQSLKRQKNDAMTVVFSTYQSMGAVAGAQKKAGKDFDLVICDEAHRTTGVESGGGGGGPPGGPPRGGPKYYGKK